MYLFAGTAPKHDLLCVRGALSCQFGDRGQSEYHSEKAKKVYAQGI